MTDVETATVDWRIDREHVWSKKGILAENEAYDARMREIDREPEI